MVDAGKMHQIDTSNVENLYSMWTGGFFLAHFLWVSCSGAELTFLPSISQMRRFNGRRTTLGKSIVEIME